MDYKWVKMPKLGYFKKFELNISSCRVFHGLSENHNIIQIGPPEQKLWPFKELVHAQYLHVLLSNTHIC